MKTVNVKYKRWFNKEFQELDEKYKENIRQFIRKKIEEVMNIGKVGSYGVEIPVEVMTIYEDEREEVEYATNEDANYIGFTVIIKDMS